jgi:hypothetical protein
VLNARSRNGLNAKPPSPPRNHSGFLISVPGVFGVLAFNTSLLVGSAPVPVLVLVLVSVLVEWRCNSGHR